MIKAFILACRPKTLPAALSPVLIGSAMAFGDGLHHWPSALLCLFAAITIQIGTNLANDYFDFKKGADTHERLGPLRATQAGLIKPEVMKWAFILTFTLAAIICIFLLDRGGWPIAVIGILSIISGILYTGGPWPLGYLGLGDIFVLIFFGPVAVGATYYIQANEINNAVLLSGLAPGLISVGILTINNLRDVQTDAKVGKKTLAVRFGTSFAQTEFLLSILGAALIPIFIYLMINDHVLILISSVVSLLAIPIIKIVFTQQGSTLNQALAATGQLLLMYSIIFSIGWVL